MTDQEFIANNTSTTEILKQVIQEIQQTPQESLSLSPPLLIFATMLTSIGQNCFTQVSLAKINSI